ncbi:MAG: esterase family protein [Bacteroidales bacterium]|nr:esterase family protein [Bacteroidales bacterium]
MKNFISTTLAIVLLCGALAQTPAYGQRPTKQVDFKLPNKEDARAKQNLRSFPSGIQHFTIDSKILGETRCYSVYVPKSYTEGSDKKYPVLYMLHGAGENDLQWANIPEGMVGEVIAESINGDEAAEMLIVFPDATTTKMGYFNVDGWNYEDFFFNELIPTIEKNFPALTDKGHRVIGGLSMGGGGSVNYALRHPDMFCAVYAMSAAVGPSNSPSFQNATDFVTAGTPEQIAAWKTVKWLLDCGDDDFLFDANIDCYKAMKKAGLPVQLRVRDGIHATYYWYRGLSLALPWFTRHMDK